MPKILTARERRAVLRRQLLELQQYAEAIQIAFVQEWKEKRAKSNSRKRTPARSL